jgi:hypothetical protein
MSGAIFEVMAGMLAASSADPNVPTDQDLARVSGEMGKILIDAVVAAPAAPNFFSQVATQMVQVSQAVHADYPGVLRGVFVRRAILSLESATNLHAFAALPAAAVAAAPARLALPGARYGLTQPLMVQAPAQPHHFAVTAGAPNGSSLQPPNAVEAARAFVDDLFQNGRIDDQNLIAKTAQLVHRQRRLRTHQLKAEAAGVRLERRLFDCGLCHGH